jgi:hypothetical protein
LGETDEGSGAYEGKTAEVRVSLQEPEAVNGTKDNMRRLAYKPVVLANADKLIVGQRVEPSNEILAIEPMVEQHRAVFGSMPPTLSLDGGFNRNTLWALVERGIDVLCPTGRTDGDGDWQKRSSLRGKFTKREFRYEAPATFIIAPPAASCPLPTRIMMG